MLSSREQETLPADRVNLAHSGMRTKRGKPISLLVTGKQPVRGADRDVGKRGWKKQKPFGNRTDKD